MGGYLSNQEETTSPVETVPKATRIRDFDRSFILFGKVNSGKSTLANLLLGCHDYAHFETHPFRQASGLTKEVHSGEAKIEASIVYGEEIQSKDLLQIQIIDQPGSNDYEFKFEEYGNFLIKCIAEAKSEMSATFLILIDLTSSYFSNKEMLTFLNIAQLLSASNYSFFPNATIVFTHMDLLVENTAKDPEQILREKLEQEKFASIQDLINLVDQRYLFINGVNTSETNRNNILKRLFQLTRPNLNVYINGNNGFEGKEFKTLLGAESESISFIKNSLKYDVEYHINPDLDLFRKYETINLEKNISGILNKLSGIKTGISVMVLLISLEEMFSEEMNLLITNLPDTYNLGKDFKNKFWEYACIVFKSAVDDEDAVFSGIQENRLLTDLYWKVKHRYTWVTKRTTSSMCSDRVLDLVRRVKFDSEGRIYTDSVVLAEMNKMIQESVEQRDSEDKTNLTLGVKNLDLIRVGLPFYEVKGKQSISINDFFWSRKSISTKVGYFILKNINQELAKKFRDQYEGETMDTQLYLKFCRQNLKSLMSQQIMRIITHGNSGFESSQLFDQLQLSPDNRTFETETIRVEFFPFSDLNLMEPYSPNLPDSKLKILIEQSKCVEISAILVLVSHGEIFSKEMKDLIETLPKNEFYQHDRYFRDHWWDKVVIVFCFEHNKLDFEKAVEGSISGNRGIRELVEKAGGGYMCVSSRTQIKEFVRSLQDKLERMEGNCSQNPMLKDSTGISEIGSGVETSIYAFLKFISMIVLMCFVLSVLKYCRSSM